MAALRSKIVFFSVALLSVLALVCSPFTAAEAGSVNVPTSADGQIYRAREVTEEVEKRFVVETPADPLGGDSSFTVGFKKQSFSSEYLALSLEVEKTSGAFAVVRLGTGGMYFQSGDIGGVNTYTAEPTDGESFLIEQKFGYWFFIPSGFKGTIYIPKSKCVFGESGALLNSLQDFCVFYDPSAGSTTRISYKSVFLCSNEQDSDKIELVDFSTLSCGEDGTIEDERFSSVNLTAANKAEKSSYLTCDGAELFNDMISSAVFGVKTASEGGKVVENTYDYGWASISLETAFEPTSGFAFTSLGISNECYFKIYLEDENGALWTPLITLASFFDFKFVPFYKDGMDVGLQGAFGCFYIPKGSVGTAYIPYDQFVPVTAGSDFMGEDIPAGETMGKIVRIHFGMDMVYGLGRSVAIGAFADVSLENETITEIVDLAKLTDEEYNAASVKSGTVVRCESTDAHSANWTWGRLTKKQLPDYVEKGFLKQMVDYCEKLDLSGADESKRAAFANKLTVAKAVYENEYASQEQVDAALKDLNAEAFYLRSVETKENSSGCKADLFADASVCFAFVIFAVALLVRERLGGSYEK